MSDYVRQKDFSVKDALGTGDPDKVIKGSDVDAELDAVVTAVASKADRLSGHTTDNVVSLTSTGGLKDSNIAETDVATLSGAQTVTGAKTHSGNLALSGSATLTLAADPTADLEAATKQYVDNAVPSYYRAEYSTAAGTDGANSVSGSWQTYPLSSETDDPDSIGSLASNAVTLDAGTYECEASVKVGSSGQAQVRLRQTSGTAATLLNGTPAHEAANYGGVQHGLTGRFTLAAQETIELQYRCATSTTAGLGNAPSGSPSNWGEPHVWGWLIVRKVA